MPSADTLPTDIVTLHAMILAERAAHSAITIERDIVMRERDLLAARTNRLENLNSRLAGILAEMKRARFGRKSERLSDEQLALALEDLEIAAAKVEAEGEKTDPQLKHEGTKKRRASRNENLDHLPHVETVIEPEGGITCACCKGELHKIGEDRTKRLDKMPAKLRVIVEVRPKYGCRTCEKTGADNVAGVVQAPAPAHLIEGGLPTEALVADVIVSKHADHQPLYRQSQIWARSGVKIERSTMAQWVGTGAFELQPLHDYLLDRLKASPKLFCDETRCPVLDPGRGKTKSGYMWALARDDRPWGGNDPPAVAYNYAPGRGAEHAVKLLAGFSGVLQIDGYAVYKQLAAPSRAGGPVTLAYCWSHLRRKFYELYVGGNAPIATAALARIKLLYEIEAEIRGLSPEVRRAIRQARAKPLIEAMKPWFEECLAKVSKGSKLSEALAYGLNHWDGLCRYLDDGRIEIDSNTVERSIRGLALTRKNALFAGHDHGAEGWATCASLIETCKLNNVDPLAWMTDVLTKLVNRWPNSRIDELMPWAYVKRA
ncbi:MAG: IS66 family transposase [Proteobacteria bacterium]|nr:IS66 family transposase [Pseudomonadota bacterium]